MLFLQYEYEVIHLHNYIMQSIPAVDLRENSSPASFAYPFWIYQWKSMRIGWNFAEIIVKINLVYFFPVIFHPSDPLFSAYLAFPSPPSPPNITD